MKILILIVAIFFAVFAFALANVDDTNYECNGSCCECKETWCDSNPNKDT